MEEIVYTVRPGTRYSGKWQHHYPVTEIIIDGGVVAGALHAADGYLFGEVEWPDGTREPQGDCTLNTSTAEETMVRNIMATRFLGPGRDWRASISLRVNFPVRRAH